MNKFDFIHGADFGEALEADYNELDICIASGSWKAAHVLAGSIIEALLVDYLISLGYPKKGSKDPLKMELGEVITLCRKDGVLTERTEQLSHAIRSYRNLIHPGRMIRLGDNVDSDSAKVAKALVDIIIKEISQKRKENYGYTADQIVTKLAKDPSSRSIIKHILIEAKAVEVEKLLIEAIPKRYLQEKALEYPDEALLSSLENCYRTAFDIADTPIRKKAVSEYVSVLKEADAETVAIHETAFFRAPDLKYADKKNSKVIKGHLFSKLHEEPTIALLQAADYIGPFLVEEDMQLFVDSLIRAIVWGKTDPIKKLAESVLSEYYDMKKNCRERCIKRLETWVNHFKSKNQMQHVKYISELKDAFEADLAT